jgi:TRAP-type C4-dicarboxylate transport system substrate-binding protein
VVEDWLDGKITTNWPKIEYSGAPITLRFTSAVPSSSTMVPLWAKGVPLLEKMTNGKLQVKQFHGGTVHGALDGFKAVRENLSDLSVCYVAFLPRGFELSRSFLYPFINPEQPAVSNRVFMELAPDYFRPEFEAAGVYYGHTAHFGHENLVTKIPIRRLEDMRGRKIAASGASVLFVKALGAAAVTVPPFDRYSAIQTGVVDGTTFTDVAILSLRLYEVAKYHTVIGSGSTQLDHCVRKEWFDALPADLKRAFAFWQQGMAAAAVKIAVLDPKKQLKELYATHNVETIALDEPELKRWREAAKPVVEEWAAASEKIGKPARKLLEEIRARAEKYAKMNDDDLFRLAIEQPVSGLIKF